MLAGLRSGVLARGDRLPSTRDLARQLSADPRAILAAYRMLEREGLVEMRPRSGIYVADRPGTSSAAPGLAESWLVELFAQGIGRDIPATDLAEWLRRSIETLRLRAVVIAATIDQREGLCRELRADYGLEATGLDPAMLVPDDSRVPIDIRRADFLLTTNDLDAMVGAIAETHRKPMVSISVRPDLVAPEWLTLLQQPSYAVVVDPLFGTFLEHYFREVAGATNLRTIVVGRDDISSIPADAPTYVTRAARAQLGGTPVPGRLVPTVRTLSPASAKEVLAIIVRSNLAVLGSRNPPDS
jgi:GntR family transcriptional regulator